MKLNQVGTFWQFEVNTFIKKTKISLCQKWYWSRSFNESVAINFVLYGKKTIHQQCRRILLISCIFLIKYQTRKEDASIIFDCWTIYTHILGHTLISAHTHTCFCLCVCVWGGLEHVTRCIFVAVWYMPLMKSLIANCYEHIHKNTDISLYPYVIT